MIQKGIEGEKMNAKAFFKSHMETKYSYIFLKVYKRNLNAVGIIMVETMR